LLTHSREREKWVLDCQKQESRELLSALSNAYSKTLFLLRPQKPLDGADGTKLREAQSNSVSIFRDRIYIAKHIRPNEMLNRRLDAIERYEGMLLPQPLHYEYKNLRDAIVMAANGCVPKSSPQRLQFWES
jgi:hypothetical protein